MTTDLKINTAAGHRPKKQGEKPELQAAIPYERMTAAAAIRLAAVHTWAASVCPALLGIFWCLHRGLPLSPAQCILLAGACVLSQSAVNTLNDYVDFVSGADSEEDHVEVNDAVLIYYRVNPKHALILGFVYLASAAFCGIAAAWNSGPVPFIIGIIGGLTVLGYSIGPLPVASLPLGELVSGFVMGGLIPLGTAAVADGRFHLEILPYSLPLILGIALIMLSNNGSDIEKDIRAERTTLPVVLGRPRALVLYRMMLAAWIALLCICPAVSTGWIGLVSFLLTALLGRKPFGFLIRAKLLPEDRIRQMKSITAANMIGNGLLSAAFAASWLLRLMGS